MMRLTLIMPKCYDRKEDEGDTLILPPLNLPTIAAITPPQWSVKIVDDRLEQIDFDEAVDLVGITCITETAGRAYDIAHQFRRRGVPVVLGGLHPTLMADEAVRRADAICCGEAFGTWEILLKDFERGSLRRIYRGVQPVDLTNLPSPRFDLLSQHRQYVHRARLANATRGCHMRCTFCSTQQFWRGTFNCRPVEDVTAEIAGGKEKLVVFVDDDIGGNKEYCRKLFETLIPLKIYWVSQTRINLCLDEELLALAAESGCIALFTGFESISAETLKEIQKFHNIVSRYNLAIENCHRCRICVEAGFMFGFDTDKRTVFQDTLRYILSSKLDSININILHPVPGTPAFEELDGQGRITTYDWNTWAAHDRCLFRPKLMSAKELEAGTAWVLREIYSWPRILKRVVRSFRWARPFAPYFLLYQNLSYKRRRVDRWERGFNPAVVTVPEQREDAQADED